MKKKSKRFETAQQLVEKRVYLVNEALEVIKRTAQQNLMNLQKRIFA